MAFLSENSIVHQYSNFTNYWLRIGADTLKDILLKIFGGRPFNSVDGIALILSKYLVRKISVVVSLSQKGFLTFVL